MPPNPPKLEYRIYEELLGRKLSSVQLAVSNRKDLADPLQALAGGPMPPCLPAHQRGRIDAQLLGHLPLRQTERPAGACQEFWESGGGRQGIVAQKPDDGWNVLDRGLGCVAFPVGDGQRMHADQLGNLRLEEAKVQSAGADMVS